MRRRLIGKVMLFVCVGAPMACENESKSYRRSSSTGSQSENQEPIDPQTCEPSTDPGFVNVHRLNKTEYNNTVRDLFGVTSKPADSFPDDDIGFGFDNNARIMSVAPLLMEKYAAAAAAVAGEVMGNQQLAARLVICDPAQKGDEACGREILENLLKKAFRRPVTAEEVTEMLPLITMAKAQGDTFQAGVQNAIEATLLSPNFLFRIVEDGSGRERQLGNHELATRMSYFLWSSMPDDKLRQQADSGNLSKPEVLQAEVERMLADPKAAALVESFAAQWLHLRDLENVEWDGNLFPQFNKELMTDAQKETKTFFAALVKENLSIKDLLQADYTYVNNRLGSYYGLTVNGENFQKVSLPANRLGVLTHASFLTATSNPTRTSPVKRGKWVMEQLLCDAPLPPPPDVDALDGKIDPNLPIKQRMAEHMKNPACAGCHKLMDPIGFGFEHFNAVGLYRETEGAHPVDPTGQLPTGEQFADHKELARLLAEKPEFPACFTEKLLTYATGRGMEYADRCGIAQLAATSQVTNYQFKDILLKVIQSHWFQKRRPEVQP